MEELIKILNEEASREKGVDWERDDNPYEASGGNFDDAYYLGCQDGARELALRLQKVLDKLSE